MHPNDRRDGSIKVLLILVLLLANIALALPRNHRTSPAPGSARASRAVFGALAENIPGSRATRALGEPPSAAREARVLPGEIPRQP
ncbi:MAG: hypothetical protein H0W66_02660 [Chthoniobacterales bacterium]|nr:hypothetical protein [Chthoniobacterales bacterium]